MEIQSKLSRKFSSIQSDGSRIRLHARQWKKKEREEEEWEKKKTKPLGKVEIVCVCVRKIGLLVINIFVQKKSDEREDADGWTDPSNEM